MVMIRSLTQAWSRARGGITASGSEGARPPRGAAGAVSLTGVGRFAVAADLLDALLRRGGGERQRADQLILAHRVPADDPLVLGHLRQDLLVAVLERSTVMRGHSVSSARRAPGADRDKERVVHP